MTRDFQSGGGDEDSRIPNVRTNGAGLRVRNGVQVTGRGSGDRVLESSGTSHWLYLLPLAQSLSPVWTEDTEHLNWSICSPISASREPGLFQRPKRSA